MLALTTTTVFKVSETVTAIYTALYQVDFVVEVVVCVVLLSFLYRAYKSTRFRGFALWGFGTLLSLWDIVTLHLFAHDKLHPELALITMLSTRVILIVDSALYLFGAIFVIREFIRLY